MNLVGLTGLVVTVTAVLVAQTAGMHPQHAMMLMDMMDVDDGMMELFQGLQQQSQQASPIQHPPVMTRPPTQNSATRAGRRSGPGKRRNRQNTLNPLEFDDDLMSTTLGNFNFGAMSTQGGASNTGNPLFDLFGLGTSSGLGGANGAGGTSWEYDDDITTSPTRFRNNRRGPSYNVYTTPRPTTTTPELPEVDDREFSIGQSLFGSTSGMGGSGYCFCSPLSSCPAKSIPRGGVCNNFLSLFMNLKFIRCCYSPSLAKQIVG